MINILLFGIALCSRFPSSPYLRIHNKVYYYNFIIENKNPPSMQACNQCHAVHINETAKYLFFLF